MASNIDPNYTKNGNFGSVLVTAACTTNQGAGTIATDIFKAATAGADGAFVDRVDFWPTATVAGTAMTATVGRVFISSVTAGATTSANTYFAGDVVLPAATAASASAASSPYSVILGYRIPSGSTVLVTTHAAPAANTAWRANVIAGDY